MSGAGGAAFADDDVFLEEMRSEEERKSHAKSAGAATINANQLKDCMASAPLCQIFACKDNQEKTYSCPHLAE
jgi:hypothetical protein